MLTFYFKYLTSYFGDIRFMCLFIDHQNDTKDFVAIGSSKKTSGSYYQPDKKVYTSRCQMETIVLIL